MPSPQAVVSPAILRSDILKAKIYTVDYHTVLVIEICRALNIVEAGRVVDIFLILVHIKVSNKG